MVLGYGGNGRVVGFGEGEERIKLRLRFSDLGFGGGVWCGDGDDRLPIMKDLRLKNKVIEGTKFIIDCPNLI
jgi:hypothetical protein